MKTRRELYIAISDFLKVANGSHLWQLEDFVAGIVPKGLARTEAVRFHAALIDLDLIRLNSSQRFVSNFDIEYWENTDKRLGLIKDIFDMYTIRLPRGFNKTTERRAKTMADVAVVAQEDINPLSTFSAQDLVRELRERGYEVEAKRSIVTVEYL